MLFPRLYIKALNKKISSFHFFGIIGFVLGFLLGLWLASKLQMQVGVIVLMSLTGATTFFLLAIGAKIITGEEVIVYYHHEIGILIMCSIVLALLNKPVLGYIDITILGIGVFLAFGRIGCFNVGCCHGKPFKKGVVYRHEHTEAGFTHYYEGVALFPVQLVESAFVFIIVIIGCCCLLLFHTLPGTVLLVYTVIYGAFRFTIEFFRGDPDRPYWKGLSEAQWTTLLLILMSAVGSLEGWLPLYGWHIALSLLIVCACVVVVIRDTAETRMLNTRHIRQIAIALDKANKLPARNNDLVDVYQTNQGLNISKGHILEGNKLVSHYTLSHTRGQRLTLALVKKIGKIVQDLDGHRKEYKISEQTGHIYHIVFVE